MSPQKLSEQLRKNYKPEVIFKACSQLIYELGGSEARAAFLKVNLTLLTVFVLIQFCPDSFKLIQTCPNLPKLT